MGLDASLGLCKNIAAVNLAADSDFTAESVIYVGTAGNLKVDAAGVGTGVTIKAAAGVTLPFLVKKVYSTANGTSAADLIRGY